MTTIDRTAYTPTEGRARLNAMRVAMARNYLRTARHLHDPVRRAYWRAKALDLLDTVRFSLETFPP